MPEAVFGRSGTLQRFDLSVSTQARATVLESTANGATLAWSFADTRAAYQKDGVANAPYARTLQHDLSQTYVERIDPQGRVVRFLAPHGTSELGAGFVRGLVGSLEISKPREASDFGRTWESREPDVEGQRASRYSLAFWLDNPLTLPTARFVRSSTNIPSPHDPSVPTIEVVTKRYDQGLIREDGVISELIGNERRAVHLDRNRLATSAIATVATLVRIDDAPRVALPATLDTILAQANPLHVERSRSAIRADAYRASIAKQTLAQILARMNAKTKTPNGSEIVAALTAEFAMRPASVERVAALLERAPADSEMFGDLRLGLQGAGTPQAQRLLARTLLARASGPASVGLAESLARVEIPSNVAIAALERLASIDPADKQIAWLSLGTAAAQIARSDPKRARPIVEHIVAALHGARTLADRSDLLLALGNSGSAEALPPVLAAAKDGNPAVRADAAIALRSLPGDSAATALAVLVHDRSDAVRIDAAVSYGSRTLSSNDIAMLAFVAHTDTNRTVRTAAVQALASAAEPFDDSEARLRSLLHDSDKNVRTAAQAAVQHFEAVREAESV